MGRTRRQAPPRSPEAQESMLINLAMQQAAEQLQSGKASSQVVTHFLRLGTEKARLEREKLEAEVELARAKAENLESQRNSEELFQRALDAFRSYGSSAGDNYYEEYEQY